MWFLSFNQKGNTVYKRHFICKKYVYTTCISNWHCSLLLWPHPAAFKGYKSPGLWSKLMIKPLSTPSLSNLRTVTFCLRKARWWPGFSSEHWINVHMNKKQLEETQSINENMWTRTGGSCKLLSLDTLSPRDMIACFQERMIVQSDQDLLQRKVSSCQPLPGLGKPGCNWKKKEKNSVWVINHLFSNPLRTYE